MQAFVFNIRRDKFKDPRVRLAMNYAFDFEEMNKQIFFGQYKRIASYFEGLELASSGLPEGKELEILETVRDKVPAGSLHQAVHQSGRRHAGERAQQSARGAAAAERGRLRGAQPEAHQRQDRRAVRRSNFSSRRRSERRALRAVLQAFARTARHDGLGPHRGRRAVSSTASAAGIRHDDRGRGASRSRPATSSAATGARRRPIRPARAI